MTTYISFGGAGGEAFGRDVVGAPVVQTWSPRWMSQLDHARRIGAAVMVDEVDRSPYPLVFDPTKPGRFGASRAKAVQAQLDAYVAEVHRQCDIARASDPTRLLIVYAEPIAGSIQYGHVAPITAHVRDEARLARAGAYDAADIVAVPCYLHAEDAEWLKRDQAAALVTAKLRGMAVHGRRRVAALNPEYAYGGEIPDAHKRAMADAARAEGCDVLWWQEDGTTAADAKRYGRSCVEAAKVAREGATPQ